jgi:Fe-S-cluster containining protein
VGDLSPFFKTDRDAPRRSEVVTASVTFESRAGADRRNDLARLCQSCGLCCDGSLFGRVVLQPGEVETARRHRLRVLASGRGFEQRCAALEAPGPVGQHRCAIYGERPRSCRNFTCRLYEHHRVDGGAIEPRLAAVRRVRELVAALEAAGWTPADFEGDGPETPAAATYAELMRRLGDDFARAG